MGSLKHLCHPRIACFLARYRSPWFVLLRVALHILNMLWGTKSCLSPLGNDYHFVLKGAQAQAGRPWPPSETAFPVSVHISKPLQDCLGLSWRPMSSVTSRLRSPGSGPGSSWSACWGPFSELSPCFLICWHVHQQDVPLTGVEPGASASLLCRTVPWSWAVNTQKAAH